MAKAKTNGISNGVAQFDSNSKEPRVAIIGTGFGGLGMAISMRRKGLHNFLLLEKQRNIGGTWRDNTYPGCACDVPSHFYSYSFDVNPNWSHVFPERSEIFAYLERLAHKYELYEQARFRTEVASLKYDEAQTQWHITTTEGETITADVVVSGLGQLNRPKIPHFKNADSFKGITFHSARWEHEHDLSNKRVGVIGNGPSAIQFVPRLVQAGIDVTLFQRSPCHVVAREDKPYGPVARFMFRFIPGWTTLYRKLLYWMLERNFVFFNKWQANVSPMMRTSLRLLNANGDLKEQIEKQFNEQVTDAQLRKVLKPDYPIGCKRVAIADDYFPALQADNCTVVTDGITAFAPDGIVTKNGKTHKLDVIIYGTGFESNDFLAPLKITGRNGAELNKKWKDGAEAYLGITMPDFPNFFMLYGPNTNLGHNSIIFMLECQFTYIMSALKQLRKQRAKSMELRHEKMDEFSKYLKARLHTSVWEQQCDSWYKNEAGRVVNNWPDFTFVYRKATQLCKPQDYQFYPSPNTPR